jgi:hypothetical protein
MCSVSLDLIHPSYGVILVPQDMVNVHHVIIMSLWISGHMDNVYMNMVNVHLAMVKSSEEMVNVSRDIIHFYLDMKHIPLVW